MLQGLEINSLSNCRYKYKKDQFFANISMPFVTNDTNKLTCQQIFVFNYLLHFTRFGPFFPATY